MTKDIIIEEEKIEDVKSLSKSQLVWNIQVFIVFATFYRRFISNFNRIAKLFISILRTTLPDGSNLIGNEIDNNAASIVGIRNTEADDNNEVVG